MRTFTFTLLFLFTGGISMAQNGFDQTAINWGLPNGGAISAQSGGLFGYLYANNAANTVDMSEGWGLTDLTGDGLPDLVVFAEGNGVNAPSFGVGATAFWQVYENTGSNFVTSPSAWEVPSGGSIDNGILNGFNALADPGSPTNGDNGWGLSDMDGDGKPDLVVFSEGTGTNNDCFFSGNIQFWKVYLNDGSGFLTSPINWTLPDGGDFNENSNHLFGFNAFFDAGSFQNGDNGWSLTDIDGDAQPDLVVFSEGDGTYRDAFGNGNVRFWEVYLNEGSSFSSSSIPWRVPEGGSIATDGHEFSFNAIADPGSSIAGDQGWQMLDMNNDSKADMVVFCVGNGTYNDAFGAASSPYWRVYLNEGDKFAENDIVWSLPEGGKIDDGNGHEYSFNGVFGGGSTAASDQAWATVDIDGDAFLDLVVYAQGNGTYLDAFDPTGSPYWKVYLNDKSSGFTETAINWLLPDGGRIDPSNNHIYSFNALAGFGSFHEDNQSWITQDMNGDGKLDLVITSEGNDQLLQAFGAGTGNSFWRVHSNLSIVGVEEIDENVAFTVFPNPSNGMINVVFDQTAQNGTLRLYNMTGAQVKTTSNLNGLQFNMDLTGMPAGIYILEADNGQQLSRTRIVLR